MSELKTEPIQGQQNLSNPALIVGCWQLDDRSWHPMKELDIAHSLDIYQALGVNQFDTADIYGRSESLLGKLLKGQNCQIFTKAVFFDQSPTPTQIRHKVENSLRNLQRDVLDGVQIHWQNPNVDFAPTLESFRQLMEQGKIRRLGVTNFNTPMLEKAVQFAPISFHQVQYSLIDRRLETSMQALCLQHCIEILPYGPIAGGFLSKRFLGLPTRLPENGHARGFYYSNMIEAHGGWQALQEMLVAISGVARKYGLTIAQVALHWVSKQAGVGRVISGLTCDRQQIQDNVKALTCEIDPADLQFLSQRSAELFQQPGDVYSYERGR